MDNENHKNTWNNFTKVCFVGNCCCNMCFDFNGNILIIKFSDDSWIHIRKSEIEKRIAITPDLVKKYISLGIEINLIENYGSHLGINDDKYKEMGAKILKDEKKF